MGGFDLALNRLGHECVYANDFDKYCKITYDKNFSARTQQGQDREEIKLSPKRDSGDIETTKRKSTGLYYHELDTTPIQNVSANSIPDHDLLVGGFPCQAFSIAGKRKGFDDTRGTLFFDIARVLEAKRPPYFILENVKGLLSHDFGRTFKRIILTLTDLGYDLQWQVLNSKNFGVPQNRERVFIVGHFRGKSRPQVFPFKEIDKNIDESQPNISSDEAIGGGGDISHTLTARYWKMGRSDPYIRLTNQPTQTTESMEKKESAQLSIQHKEEEGNLL